MRPGNRKTQFALAVSHDVVDPEHAAGFENGSEPRRTARPWPRFAAVTSNLIDALLRTAHLERFRQVAVIGGGAAGMTAAAALALTLAAQVDLFERERNPVFLQRARADLPWQSRFSVSERPMRSFLRNEQ